MRALDAGDRSYCRRAPTTVEAADTDVRRKATFKPDPNGSVAVQNSGILWVSKSRKRAQSLLWSSPDANGTPCRRCELPAVNEERQSSLEECYEETRTVFEHW